MYSYKTFLSVFFLLITLNMFSSKGQAVKNDTIFVKKKLIFSDNFNHGLDTTAWISEIDTRPNSTVTVDKGKLILNTGGGVTVWLNKLLKGNIQIEFTRKVIMDGGIHDRLSDMNQFWMAQDPKRSNLFTRQGKFEEYDSLTMYYAGIGGNTNTTTRFRKYNGGDRKLIQEYLDKDHLLQPNKEYHIKIIVLGNTTSLYVDGMCYFSFTDPDILKEGYFGFRSTHSRQEIDNVKVYWLVE